VFAGAFSLDAVSAVAMGGGAVSAVIEGLANLIAKSLVLADVGGDIAQYRLLDTTRAYALQKLIETGRHAAFLRRHAEYHRDLLQQAEAEWEGRPTDDWLSDYRRKIDDVRGALEWAFSAGGDTSIGVALTVAALPLWLHLSLMDECRICAERALTGDPLERRRSESDDMKLYAALGAALLYARGPIPEADVIWSRSLQGAENLANSEYQLRALWGLSAYRIAVGDYRDGLQFAERFCVLANERGDTAAWLNGGRMIGAALHYIGDQANARQHLDRMVTHYIAPPQRSHVTRFLFDQSSLARGTLSNVLWLQGYPDQAVRIAQAALDGARAIDHVLSLCSVLVHSVCTIALYIGDLTAAEHFLALLQDHLAKHTLTVWNALARCLRGMLLIERGDIAGLPLLRSALGELREVRFVTRYPAYLGVLAQALGAHGHAVEARNVIDEAVTWAAAHEERWCMPELFRIKAELLQRDSAGAVAAEEHYMRALEGAREQQALSWELRAATGLAGLWHQHGRSGEANELLSSTYSRFTEGFETRDLRLARALLDRAKGEPMHRGGHCCRRHPSLAPNRNCTLRSCRSCGQFIQPTRCAATRARRDRPSRPTAPQLRDTRQRDQRPPVRRAKR
jgi:predicted ATPase